LVGWSFNVEHILKESVVTTAYIVRPDQGRGSEKNKKTKKKKKKKKKRKKTCRSNPTAGTCSSRKKDFSRTAARCTSSASSKSTRPPALIVSLASRT
jgi:hypothetical protein